MKLPPKKTTVNLAMARFLCGNRGWTAVIRVQLGIPGTGPFDPDFVAIPTGDSGTVYCYAVLTSYAQTTHQAIDTAMKIMVKELREKLGVIHIHNTAVR